MSSSPFEAENAAAVAASVNAASGQSDHHKSPSTLGSHEGGSPPQWTPPPPAATTTSNTSTTTASLEDTTTTPASPSHTPTSPIPTSTPTSHPTNNPPATSTSLLTQGLQRQASTDRTDSRRPSFSHSHLRNPVPPASQPDSTQGPLFTLPEEESSSDGAHQLDRSDVPSTMAMVVPAPAPARDVGPTEKGKSEMNLHEIAHLNSLLSNRRDIFTGTRGRGTSLERTEKEKRVHYPPQRSYSLNPGDTGMSHVSRPVSPETGDASAHISPIEDLRASYRSWRDLRPNVAAEKTWSIGGQGGEGHEGGQVEKSITEALAGVEHSSRSRKASHSLGYFKEGLPEDQHRKKDKNRGRSKESSSHGPRSSLDTHAQHDPDHPPTLSSSRTSSRPSALPSPIDLAETWSANNVSSSSTAIHPHLNPTEGLAPEGEYYDPSHSIETIPETQLKTMPPQLLEDIRRYHNLTPGGAKGSSFSPSIPVTQAEKSKSPPDEAPLPEPQLREEKEGDGAELSPVKSCEDDESGEEQISSALFVPHQTARESRDHGDDGESLTGASRKSSDTQQWLEEHTVTPPLPDQHQIGEEAKRWPQPPSLLEKTPRVEREGYFPDVIASTDQEYYDDAGYTTREESGFTDDQDVTPTESLQQPAAFPSSLKQDVPDQQSKQKKPLEAIELIPYKHQVGGHTTMWRFSKRAVCKQLNNRENEFYEKVERYHPELLKFLPRYIGVLNVTFEKQQRRKTFSKKDGADLKQDKDDNLGDAKDKPADSGVVIDSPTLEQPPEFRRVVSQSLQSSSIPIPKVTFADNRHIIPSSLLQPQAPFLGPQQRSKSDITALSSHSHAQLQSPTKNDSGNRPTLSERHAASWGWTTVNKKLRNEVFGEAFLQQPIPVHRHKRPASQHRSLTRSKQHSLRASNSDPNLKPAKQDPDGPAPALERSIRRQAIETAAEQMLSDHQLLAIGTGRYASDEDGPDRLHDMTGTSAPEPEIARSRSPRGNRRQRRYSSGALRRKPTEVAEDRGNLKYFEEADDAGYKGDAEDVFHMDPDASRQQGTVPTDQQPVLDPRNGEHATQEQDVKPAPRTEVAPLVGSPRPANPKEAQTHKDSRVEYFLLLEDLTAGMKRPCIMDLKMGTRQYGVDANEKKQKSQQKKCAETTSKELGVRVCGLQVWDSKTQSYIFQDKYFGRDLKAGRQFQDALTRFLYDGVDYSSVLRHIPTIIRKLSELEVIIRGLVGYRFYAASLLMFYDGDAGDEYESDSAPYDRELKPRKEIDFKIADFANCVTKENLFSKERTCPPKHPELPDKGFLRGLKSLKRYFLAIQKEIQAQELGLLSPEVRNGLSDDPLEADKEDEGGMSY